MMRAVHFAMACVAVLVATAGPVRAAILYDNGGIGPPLADDAYFSQENYLGGLKVADDFSFAASSTIESVTFWGVHWYTGDIPTDDTYEATVYGNAGGLPDPSNVIGVSTLSLVSRVDTGFDHNGKASANILEYTMTFDTPIFIPDTATYWFSIQSTTTDTSDDDIFAWQEVTGGPGSKAFSEDNGANWTAVDEDVAFNLSGTSSSTTVIPEPCSLALFGLGAFGMAVGAVRRGQRRAGSRGPGAASQERRPRSLA